MSDMRSRDTAGGMWAAGVSAFAGIVLATISVFEILEAIAASSVFMAVPPMYYKLLDEPQFVAATKSWTRPRLFTCGSAPIRS